MVFKKALAALLAGAAITLSACGDKSADKPELAQDYSFKAEITANGSDYKADIQTVHGVWNLTYSAPDEIAGMTVTLKGEECKVDYMGMEMAHGRMELPPAAFSGLISNTLEAVSYDSSVRFSRSDDKLKAAGIVEGADFTVIFDSKSKPCEISLNDGTFKVKLTDMKDL